MWCSDRIAPASAVARTRSGARVEALELLAERRKPWRRMRLAEFGRARRSGAAAVTTRA